MPSNDPRDTQKSLVSRVLSKSISEDPPLESPELDQMELPRCKTTLTETSQAARDLTAGKNHCFSQMVPACLALPLFVALSPIAILGKCPQCSSAASSVISPRHHMLCLRGMPTGSLLACTQKLRPWKADMMLKSSNSSNARSGTAYASSTA